MSDGRIGKTEVDERAIQFKRKDGVQVRVVSNDEYIYLSFDGLKGVRLRMGYGNPLFESDKDAIIPNEGYVKMIKDDPSPIGETR